jgi:hypothetical protein
VAAIGCNIHDQMVGFIKVVDTAYAAKSDANGVAVIRDLPDGPVVAKRLASVSARTKEREDLGGHRRAWRGPRDRDDRTTPRRPLTRCSGASRPS